ncbi:hypothetical protein P6U16_26230 (plasmid) [Rhizobium sp. 32-5/1]|nr:hypothetical protein [Rhizobium sp. 32-5/1]WEZ85545.1 hypothetical protein P6U16_26230 [Rhizobium sp. 32-5/1]
MTDDDAKAGELQWENARLKAALAAVGEFSGRMTAAAAWSSHSQAGKS